MCVCMRNGDYQNMAHKNTDLRNRACNIKQSAKLKLRCPH